MDITAKLKEYNDCKRQLHERKEILVDYFRDTYGLPDDCFFNEDDDQLYVFHYDTHGEFNIEKLIQLIKIAIIYQKREGRLPKEQEFRNGLINKEYEQYTQEIVDG